MSQTEIITFILKKPGVANFADIINHVNHAIMLVKTTFKNSIKVKKSQLMNENAMFTFMTQYNKKLLVFGET